MCEDIFDLAEEAHVDFVPEVSDINGKTIRFVTGESSQKFDEIILCTGFHSSCSFLPKEFDYNNLLDFMVHREEKGLFFVGMLQPVGPVPPIVEMQTKVISGLIKNNSVLEGALKQSYEPPASSRVWFDEYAHSLRDKYPEFINT